MCPLADDFRKANGFTNEPIYERLVYDFSKDGGAIDIFDLLQVNESMVIEEAWINVKTAVTSAGAPTVEAGVKGGDTDAILPATLKGALLLSTTIDSASASKRLRLAKDAILALQIKVAVLTAGVIEINVILRRF